MAKPRRDVFCGCVTTKHVWALRGRRSRGVGLMEGWVVVQRHNMQCRAKWGKGSGCQGRGHDGTAPAQNRSQNADNGGQSMNVCIAISLARGLDG